MKHKENIFDLYNAQHRETKPQAPERVPEEVRPEDLNEPEEVPAEEQKAPEPEQEEKPEPAAEEKEEEKNGIS